jgi:acetate kinase
MRASGPILTLNAGSSNLKFALFDPGFDGPAKVCGEIQDIKTAPKLQARDARGAMLEERSSTAGETPDFADLIEMILTCVERYCDPQAIAAVGHRIVYGGAQYLEPTLVTPALYDALADLTPFDPIHMPRNLAAIQAILVLRPQLPQVACFDTAFHHTIPAVAYGFALPRTNSAAGVRRYGFHGLSYEFISGRLKQQSPELARGRVIVAHLGSGASLCALQDGRSIATTMGLSTLDGLVMATRCGSLDPGAILYLGRQGYSFGEIETLLYEESGLLGVSGLSGDMRVLLASDDPHAREAIDLFTYRVAVEAGSMVSALGGLDGLVFTGGIGERSAAIRSEICARLAWLGLHIDPAANVAGLDRISTPDSKIYAGVIPTNEELMIAHHTSAQIQAEGSSRVQVN